MEALPVVLQEEVPVVTQLMETGLGAVTQIMVVGVVSEATNIHCIIFNHETNIIWNSRNGATILGTRDCLIILFCNNLMQNVHV